MSAIPTFKDRNLPVSAFRKHPDSLLARSRRAAVMDGRELFVNDGEGWPAPARPGRLRSRRPEIIPGGDEPLRKFTGELCPLGSSWRLWDMLGREERDYRYLSSNHHKVCARARRLLPIAHRGFVDLDWEIAADDSRRRALTSGEFTPTRESSSLRHTHAEATVDGHWVHVDVLSASHGGPGRAYAECRIFVDGRLAGRGGKCGCALGFGTNDLPAVAAVGINGGITVDLPTGRGPIVELWHAHLAGVCRG